MKARNLEGGQESGFSLIELLIVIVIIGILSTLTVIFVNASRRAANGASAIQSMRVLSQCQAGYSAGVGNQNYADSQELFNEDFIENGLARACIPTPTGTSKGGSPALGRDPKSGFVFNFNRTLATSTDSSKFDITGTPAVTSGSARTGDRTFFVDQTSVIRTSSLPTDLADSSSKPID